MRTSAHCAILRVKSPPHLEPWDIQHFLEHGFAAKRRENASAPQNGISSQTQQGIPPQGFQNHIPARGRKHLFIISEPVIASAISKPYPRKGTETFLGIRWNQKLLWYFKTIPPQGDGNHDSVSFLVLLFMISKPYPRKGTETIHGAQGRGKTTIISKPYPRKGTETVPLML